MNEGMSVLVGMSIAYVASFIGMIVAYVAYKRRHKNKQDEEKEKNRD
jgi:H+/gluconate symporter-like permease